MDHFVGQNALLSPLVHFASTEPDFPDALAQAVSAMGARLSHTQISSTGLGSPPFGSAPDMLVITCASVEDVAVAVRFAEEAAHLHCPVILSASLSLLDVIPERLWASCHAILIDPDSADYAAAISVALSTRPGRLSDVSRDVDAARLQRLADEVGRIARTLANLSAQAPLPGSNLADMRPDFFGESSAGDNLPSSREIRGMIRMRRMRDRFFDADLFADPAWDMLLDLMAARLERVQVAVSSLCIAAAVPPTTALRWIKVMTESGLFERVSDPVDGRRVFIRLSDPAAEAMTRYLGSVRAAQERLI